MVSLDTIMTLRDAAAYDGTQEGEAQQSQAQISQAGNGATVTRASPGRPVTGKTA